MTLDETLNNPIGPPTGPISYGGPPVWSTTTSSPIEPGPVEVPVLRVWLVSGDWLDLRRLPENSEWHVLLGLPEKMPLDEAVDLPNAVHGVTSEGRRVFIPWDSVEFLELVDPET